MKKICTVALVALVLFSSPLFAAWQTMDLHRARVADCTDDCTYVDSADLRSVSDISGILMINRDDDGAIRALAVYGAILFSDLDTLEINYYLPIIKSVNAGKVMITSDGERSTVYLLQNRTDKFGFSIDYHDQGMVEYFKGKAY